jgi:osmotically-inducible protein OsmY
VTVRGMVPDDAAKTKAIALIKDTVGVTHVIDQINVVQSSAATFRSIDKR